MAGPCVDLSIARTTFEAARMLVRVYLFCRGVTHPATGAGEFFCCPDAVGHALRMYASRETGDHRRVSDFRRRKPIGVNSVNGH